GGRGGGAAERRPRGARPLDAALPGGRREGPARLRPGRHSAIDDRGAEAGPRAGAGPHLPALDSGMGDAANLPGAGTLTRAPDGRYRVRFVRAYDRPVADLWEAITAPERLDTWYPAKLRTSGVVGEPVTEAFESTDGTPPPEAPPGTLTVFEPPHVFAFEVYGPPDSPYPGMRGRQDIRMEAREGSREDESGFTLTHGVEQAEAALRGRPGWPYC